MYFSAAADQTEVVKLKQGMVSELVFDSYPDEKVTGTVYQIKMSYPAAIGRFIKFESQSFKVIGVVFGVFPAKKAADLSPIDAIRYE